MTLAWTTWRPFRTTQKTGRRKFLLRSFLFFVGLTGLNHPVTAGLLNFYPSRPASKPSKNPVIPPGSESLKHFIQYCTSCHLCMNVCPTRIVKASFLEYGLTGMMRPYLDFETGGCEAECIACGTVCPTGAIRKITVAEKKIIKIGQVKYNAEKCLIYTENKKCLDCYLNCPNQAIQIVKTADGKSIPLPENEYCTGCGTCEHVCDAWPEKAIYIEALTEHKKISIR